jgi:hypothetical protein
MNELIKDFKLKEGDIRKLFEYNSAGELTMVEGY